ncbi:peptidoglycan-binding protein [Roseibium salinum]|uniref:Peptidoglycan-binding protein n=1 Tax=Roseibium salinum TaxID=1604349 RepID=A0ABT3R3D6_9HYPH|nr:peptidoglycan-binding protein [Roseibium sp. DSM 29163]MCX2723640.1 peptidoglycan-binding protein [Roseibium sp. DSM 29163]
MPAWKKHEAGRRSRDAHESDGYYDAPQREAARNRIERLTRTATALGGGYDTRLDEPDDDLDAVADELDRLLSDQEKVAAPRSAAPRPDRPSRSPRRRAPVRDTGLEDVLGALDRLDQQVQGLAGEDDDYDDEEPYRAPERPRRRPGRYALDALREDAYPEGGDDYYDDEDERGYGRDYPPRERVGRARREESMHVYKDLGRRIDALRAPQEKALDQVREELGSLRDVLGGFSRGTNETVSRQNAELRRLADMVERLRVDKTHDHLAKDIRKEVSELKSMVGRTNVEGALQTLEHGYAHILQRLDELSRASVDPRVMRSVTARLDEIEDTFAALPRSEHMTVLEDRVVTIAERMEELLQRKGHAEIEPLRAELREVRDFVEQIDIKGLVEGIDDRMKFVSGRLDDLEVLAREQRGLDSRLSAMEDRMPEPETISRLQGRLEDIVGMMADDRAAPVDHEHMSHVDRRLNEIVDRLERMEQAGPLPSANAGAFEALEKRLEMISGKIDTIEKRASRPVPVLDAAAMKSSGAPDGKFLNQLQERLNDLTVRLDQPRDTVTTADLDKLREEIGSMRASVAAPASTDALERRISDLAQIVSKGADATDDSRFELLGEKVAALAEQIEETSSKALSVEQFSPVLERIEQSLEQTRTDVAGIARKAAAEAVANAPALKNSQYDEAITALQGDLKRLLDAAEGGEERTRNTFDGVKSVLGSLTERLDNLERTDATAPAASFSPARSEEDILAFPNYGSSKPREDNQANRSEGSENDRPQERVRDRKADFIAAARRAAQAASAEAAQLEKKQKAGTDSELADEERGRARVGWLRNVLKRDKSAAAAEADQEPADDLELAVEDIADKAFEANDATVLPGDRPAPENTPSPGGRRRAILYTAAAVVLLIGTLQVFRLAGDAPDEGADLAAVTPEKVETVEVAPASEETDLTAAAAEATAQEKAAEMAAEAAAVKEAPEPARTVAASSASSATQTPNPEAPAETSAAGSAPAISTPAASAPRSASVAASDNVQAASATGTLAPETELAFAPPAGVASSFGAHQGENPAAFTPADDTAAGTGEAASNLIANLPPEGVGPMALRSAAASGNPAAEFLVGVKYTEGNGVPADLARAAVWYQKAAQKGLPPAQYRLASLYEKGRGVEKDLAKARAWYTSAAEAGNAKAMHNLAVLHAEGGGEQPDYAAAAKWFEAAANYGVKDSLFNLGILYAGGIGVDKDLVASYKWFAIAADQGDPEAAKRRDDVANMMDQETLANARLAVEAFKLVTPEPAANKVTMEPDWVDSVSPSASQASVQAVDNTPMIRAAQDKLNYLGFDTGTPDGQMGPRTRSAIRAFQRSLGLPETGEVDSRLMKELNSQAI